MKKTFLVTGGCGFIGSHLSQALFELGHSVIIIDDFSSGDVDNISEFVKDVKLYACKVEEFNFESLDKIDCIFHLAAQASVPYSIDNLFESSSTNLLSTLKVIEFGLKEDVPVVYASSSALYGNLSTGIENSDVDLLSPYAVDKLVAEIYFDMAHKV